MATRRDKTIKIQPCLMPKFRVFFPRRHSRGPGIGFGVGLALGLGFGLGLRHKSWLASYLSY
jgi:hypothetical protein